MWWHHGVLSRGKKRSGALHPFVSNFHVILHFDPVIRKFLAKEIRFSICDAH
jgi:hypothetical protein